MACATIFALFAALWTPAGSIAHAQTISNIAYAEWDEGGERVRRPSNQVDLEVEPIGGAPPEIGLFQFGPGDGGGGVQIVLNGTNCVATPPFVSPPLGETFIGQPIAPATVSGASAIRPGEPLVFMVEFDGANRNPDAAETYEIIIETEQDDRERIRLVETGADTGVFTGFIYTVAVPPEATPENCELSVVPGSQLRIAASGENGVREFRELVVDVLESFGSTVFDSETGDPVNGARVTLVDADTGQPVQLFGNDGFSDFPSTVVTGQSVTDGRGLSYDPGPGDFFFAVVPPGRYRLIVEPPDPYTGISQAEPRELAAFVDSRGNPYDIVQGSYGDAFVIGGPSSIEIDIPLDQPTAPLSVEKAASRQLAQPGDPVLFSIRVSSTDQTRPTRPITIRDTLPSQLRLRPDSLRLDGAEIATGVEITPDGREFSVRVPPLAAGAAATLTYITEVLPQARAGDAINSARAEDDRGQVSDTVDAAVRIERETIASRMTIIGRITEGGCGVDPRTATGVPGVRVMMEDGSYSVTDEDGRYHFEAVTPGLHVVQIDESTLPLDRAAVDCARNTRSAGRAFSRFVEGRGGGLYRADFRVRAVEPREAPESASAPVARPEPLSDIAAAGGERDWLDGEEPGIAWLFPAADHNPRARVIRVAIKHAPGQTVRLSLNGEPVASVAFEGLRTNAAGTVSVSQWRGIGIEPRASGAGAIAAYRRRRVPSADRRAADRPRRPPRPSWADRRLLRSLALFSGCRG
ncbi:MAG: carboxypeptidase-like regulatory domain-containing protein [Pseudomonadota bacterium]